MQRRQYNDRTFKIRTGCIIKASVFHTAKMDYNAFEWSTVASTYVSSSVNSTRFLQKRNSLSENSLEEGLKLTFLKVN